MNKNMLLVLSFIFSINYSVANIKWDNSTITDEQAIELGMTEVKMSRSKKKEMIFAFNDSYLDMAKVVIIVNKSVRSEDNKEGQTIKVFQGGVFVHEFDTSTGTEKIKVTTSGRKYIATTPVGIFRIKRAFKEYQSKAFFGARMDYAVFFYGGIAAHSTSKSAYKKLGKRASGGCARLRFEDAQTLNELIRTTGEGHSNLWDVGFDGLERTQYSDRIKLPNLGQFSGKEQGATSNLWTYDAAVIVVN